MKVGLFFFFRKVPPFASRTDNDTVFIQGLHGDLVPSRLIGRTGSLQLFQDTHFDDTGSIIGYGHLTMIVKVGTVVHTDHNRFCTFGEPADTDLRISPG